MSLQLKVTVLKATKPEQSKKKDGTFVLNKSGIAMTKSFLTCSYQDGNYSKNVTFECIDKTADTAFSFPIGTTMDVTFNIESREWEGKFYTTAKVWKFENIDKPESFLDESKYAEDRGGKYASGSGGYAPSIAPPEEVDDLPF